MSDFLYLFRLPANSSQLPDSPQRMQERLQKWTAWFQELDAQGHIKLKGHALTSQGAVVQDKRGPVHDGPYVESKDLVMGFTVIEARDLAHAAELARGCPVLEGGGHVEVRPLQVR